MYYLADHIKTWLRMQELEHHDLTLRHLIGTINNKECEKYSYKMLRSLGINDIIHTILLILFSLTYNQIRRLNVYKNINLTVSKLHDSYTELYKYIKGNKNLKTMSINNNDRT